VTKIGHIPTVEAYKVLLIPRSQLTVRPFTSWTCDIPDKRGKKIPEIADRFLPL